MFLTITYYSFPIFDVIQLLGICLSSNDYESADKIIKVLIDLLRAEPFVFNDTYLRCISVLFNISKTCSETVIGSEVVTMTKQAHPPLSIPSLFQLPDKDFLYLSSLAVFSLEGVLAFTKPFQKHSPIYSLR